jgi:hypothetical protein
MTHTYSWGSKQLNMAYYSIYGQYTGKHITFSERKEEEKGWGWVSPTFFLVPNSSVKPIQIKYNLTDLLEAEEILVKPTKKIRNARFAGFSECT